MPALMQICVVIVTIGLVVIAVMTVRMMIRFSQAADELSRMTRAVRESAAKFDLTTHETGALVASLRDCVPPIRRAVNRFESVGRHAADISSTLLEELELPVYTAAAVASGVRAGATHLLKRLVNRFTARYSPRNGEHDDE